MFSCAHQYLIFNLPFSIAHLYGVSEETFLRCCDNVIDALLEKMHMIIKFPQPQEFRQIANNFNSSGKEFPNVVGCIDGTHLRIEIKRNFERRSY